MWLHKPHSPFFYFYINIMNNKTLQDYYTTYAFKDNAGTKYFFDIVAIRSDGASEVECPIVSIRQNRKEATGAETFKLACEQIENTRSAIAVVIREYAGFANDCPPISENRVEIRTIKIKKDNKKNKKNQGGNKQQQFPPQFPYSGFGGDDTSRFLSGVNNQLNALGLGTLQQVMQGTANQLAVQEKYEDAKMVIQELKLDNKQALGEIQRLKDQLEDEKDRYRHLEYKLQDAIRENKMQRESYESSMKWTSVIARGIGGAALDKLGLTDKIAGFMGVPAAAAQQIPQQQAAAAAQQNLDDIDLTPSNSETSEKVSEITKYLKSLDVEHIEKICAICEFVSTSDDRLNAVIQYIDSKK